MTLTTPPPSPTATSRPASGHVDGIRLDIEGLRAIAIGTVLLYHAGLPVPGGFIGVDVFFVISGFLITSLLVREVERDRRVSLPRFYARRARRLLPASALVLAVTALITWATAPVVAWRTFGGDLVSAALYVVNWRLADRSVDYLAEGTGASPVQHFWSLAVEEQFYIVWPLLLIAVAWAVRRHGWRVRATMAGGLAVIVVPSLAWSVYLTEASPGPAYFVTTTRLWELGIGAFVAVGAALWPRIPAVFAAATGWTGLAMIAGGAVLFDATFSWPGAWALVPTLGTALVLVSGSVHTRSPQRLLSYGPAVWVGSLSYSIYLWHWPILIGFENLYGDPTTAEGLVLVMVTLIPAWLSLKLLEDPVRFSKSLVASTRRTLGLGAALTAVGVVAGLVLTLAVPRVDTDAPAMGAAALSTSEDGTLDGVEDIDSAAGISPAPAAATDDVPDAYDRGCQVDHEGTAPKLCEYGDPEGSRTVVLAGDSKAVQWISALDEVASRQGWRLVTMTKSSCGLYAADRSENGVPYRECRAHNRAVVDKLATLSPDLLIVSQRHDTARDPQSGENSRAAMVQGLVKVWRPLVESGTEVIALLDNPTPVRPDGSSFEVYECVAEHTDDLRGCGFPREAAIAESGAGALTDAAAEVPGVGIVDLTDALCNDSTCPPVIGNTLVYRQGSHLTDTYVRSLTDILEQRLTSRLGW